MVDNQSAKVQHFSEENKSSEMLGGIEDLLYF